MVMAFFAGIIFCILGIFLFRKPDLYWKLTEKWKSCRTDEPSDLFLLSTKFGGILFVLLGIVLIVLPWILK